MDGLLNQFLEWIQGGVGSDFLRNITLVIGVSVASWIANIIAKRWILHGFAYMINRSKFTWDDLLLEKKVFNRLSHVAPVLVIYGAVSVWMVPESMFFNGMRHVCFAYMIVIGVLVIDAVFNVVTEIFQRVELNYAVAIRTGIQVSKIGLYFLGSIVVVAILVGKSPWVFLSGLGAMTAILLLVFKDSILGFVASIQLAANQLVQPGDWIEMPKYGADGDVIEVNLTSIKVQNWDMTITTIPTVALVSDAVKNWRGMSESDGRRIKRAIYIDMNSVQFCSAEMVSRLKAIQLLSGPLEEREREIAKYNQDMDVDPISMANGRRLTNLGMFRLYTLEYLKAHASINQNMTLLVRQLGPTDKGVPIQVYAFSVEKEWIKYEEIQSDIFDHLIAILPEFGLHVFQTPSGSDIQTALKNKVN